MAEVMVRETAGERGGSSATDGTPWTSSGSTPMDAREIRHEVVNTLAIASGYAQLLLRRAPTWADERDRRALLAILQSITRASRLLAPVPPPRPPALCDLRAIIARAADLVPAHRQADVTVALPTDGPLLVECDAERIAQVLANLLDNAAKYSLPGTPIEVELERVVERARVVVRDQGIGLGADDMEAVFHGHRTRTARQMAAGSGIGLQLSRRLIEADGGRLWAMSVSGRGSAFYVEVPLAPAGSGRAPDRRLGSR